MLRYQISSKSNILKLVAIILLFCGLTGCANSNSIYRTPNLNEGHSVVTDAKQRIITNIKAEESNYFVGRLKPSQIICTEPSPDVAQSISTAINASIEAALTKGPDGKNVAGAFGLSSADSIAQLGERIATIQLLRDELSDLCRAYSNGAVSATTYNIRLSKLDKKMVTLLISETSAGAFGRRLATAGTVATAGISRQASSEEIKKARDKVESATKTLSTKQKTVDDKKKEISDLGTNPDTTVLKQKQSEQLTAEKERDDTLIELHSAQSELYGLLATDLRTTANSMPANDIGSISGRSNSQWDGTLIQKQFLDVDELSTVVDACLTAMDMLRVPKKTEDNELTKLNSDLATTKQRRTKLESDYYSKKTRLYEQTDRLKNTVTTSKAETEHLNNLRDELDNLRGEIEVLSQTEKSKADAIAQIMLSDHEPLSTLGKTCYQSFPQILQVIEKQALRGERNVVLTICGPVLDGSRSTSDESLKAYCKKTIEKLSTTTNASTQKP